jgi:hypothetical protein
VTFFVYYISLFLVFVSYFAVLCQKRLKKERRARRRLADQLEIESKRRTQFEEALKSTSSETFRAISGASIHSIIDYKMILS